MRLFGVIAVSGCFKMEDHDGPVTGLSVHAAVMYFISVGSDEHGVHSSVRLFVGCQTHVRAAVFGDWFCHVTVAMSTIPKLSKHVQCQPGAVKLLARCFRCMTGASG